MLTVPRSVLRTLRSVHRKAATERPRGQPPPVAVRPDGDAAVWAVSLPDVVVTCRVPGPAAAFDPFLLPAAALDAVAGPGSEPVTLSRTADRVELSWADRGRPRTDARDVTPIPPADALPPLPGAWGSVPADFLPALHEAGRTAARKPARFAFHRVQVKGKAGVIVGSDGAAAYRHAGFTFPFVDDLLVPAVPVFDLPAWRSAAGACVGLGDGHLVVRAGPWTAYLGIDRDGRYPDVDAVVPKTSTPAAAVLDPADAIELVKVLPTLPGHRDDRRPVTLDLTPGRPLVVRGRDEATGTVAEHVLARSPVARGPARAAVDRAFLARAVRLGCRTVRVFGPGKPVVASTDRVTWLTAPLTADAVVPAADAPAAPGAPPPSSSNRRPAMKPIVPANVLPHAPAGPPGPVDPLAEAEALRAALFAAAQAAVRLIARLKGDGKDVPALAVGPAGPQTLTLGP